MSVRTYEESISCVESRRVQCSNGLQSQIDTSLSFFNSVLVACTEPVCRESYASELCSISAYQTCEFIT